MAAYAQQFDFPIRFGDGGSVFCAMGFQLNAECVIDMVQYTWDGKSTCYLSRSLDNNPEREMSTHSGNPFFIG